MAILQSRHFRTPSPVAQTPQKHMKNWILASAAFLGFGISAILSVAKPELLLLSPVCLALVFWFACQADLTS